HARASGAQELGGRNRSVELAVKATQEHHGLNGCLPGLAQGLAEEIIGLHEAAADAIDTSLIDDIGPVVGDCHPICYDAGPPGCPRTFAPVVVILDGDRSGKNLVCKYPDPTPNDITRVLGSECENYA